MSMTNQKLIQNYLDKHDIGQLFEVRIGSAFSY